MNKDEQEMLSKKIRVYAFGLVGVLVYFELLVCLLDKWL